MSVNGSERNRIFIERAITPSETVRELVEALEAELAVHYPPEQRHGLSLEALFQPHIRFFIASLEGVAVGCGGLALYSDFAEVKRMYVRPDARGQGIAEVLVGRLESIARENDLSILRLETGTMQLAAIRFYERVGFAACGAFEPYLSMAPDAIATSLFFEKQLA